MAQYYERSGKFATTSLRYICVVFRLGAQVSRELIILCTNLTVRMHTTHHPLINVLQKWGAAKIVVIY
jgi:hypothetical protein